MTARPQELEISQARQGSIETAIRQRAYAIYCQRAGAPGTALDDWLQAEREVLQELASRAMPEGGEAPRLMSAFRHRSSLFGRPPGRRAASRAVRAADQLDAPLIEPPRLVVPA
jgi:hypothetical protein